MRPSRTAIAILSAVLSAPFAAFAQYAPYVSSVRNSASYAEGIAQGSIFAVFGGYLGPAELQQAQSYPLQPDLAGTSVTITSGGRSFPCPMFYSWDRQLAAIMPSDVPVGDAILRVTYQGLTSYDYHFQVTPSSFGIYTPTAYGSGPGAITGVDYRLKSVTNSAKAAEILTIWGTGLGAIPGSDAVIPTADNRFADTEVFVGNVRARVEYAGRSGCCAGLDQINFELPASLSGCFVPVVVRASGITSNFVTVSVDASGENCSGGVPELPAEALRKTLAGDDLRYGGIALGPLKILQDLGFSFTKVMADRFSDLLGRKVSERDVRQLIAAYRSHKTQRLKSILAKYGIDIKHANSRLLRTLRATLSPDEQGVGVALGILHNAATFSLLFAANFTSVGSCTVTTGFPNMAPPRSSGLDAGAMLTIDGPAGRHVLQQASKGEYLASLGTTFPDGLPAGTYTISGSGGTGIGPFGVSISIANNMAWTNKSAINFIDRSVPLVVTWAGAPAPGYVLIAGGSYGSGFVGRTFICVEDGSKGTFTVPTYVLSLLSPANAKDGMVVVAPHPFSNHISIPGLDAAYIANVSAEYKSVEVR